MSFMKPPTQKDFTVSFADVEHDPASVRRLLSKFGVAIVTGVVPGAELQEWGAELREFAAQHPGRDNVWAKTAWGKWQGDCGIGHVDALWRARTHPNVLRVYAAANGCVQLVTSFDGALPEPPCVAHHSKPFALHTDQGRTHSGERLPRFIQGVLSLTQTKPKWGGTSVVPGSHLVHHLFNPDSDSDEFFFRFGRAEHKILKDHKLQRVDIGTSPGDIVLWDSRTADCGRRAREVMPADAWRLAFFICRGDAARFCWNNRERLEQLRRGISTNHHPDGRSPKPPPAPGLSRVIRSAPDWVLRSPEWLRLSGAQPYPAGGVTRDLEGFCPLTGGGGRAVGAIGAHAVDAGDVAQKRLKWLEGTGVCSSDGAVITGTAAAPVLIDLTGDDEKDDEKQRRGGSDKKRRQQQAAAEEKSEKKEKAPAGSGSGHSEAVPFEVIDLLDDD